MDEIFKSLVEQTSYYLVKNNLKAMVLGISGGIDSTVCAAICHEVSKKTGIPLIGRSLPTRNNKEGEVTAADLVGKAFCDDYSVYSINDIYQTVRDNTVENPNEQTLIADGNIQARLRMIYLYNLASTKGGLVIDTDNLTEHNLGYFTIHGDQGDLNPIGSLWKTEIFELAEWLLKEYQKSDYHQSQFTKATAMWKSLQLKPTAGLGITDSDLDEIGAESYEQVDDILKKILCYKDAYRDHLPECKEDFIKSYLKSYPELNQEVAEKVVTRHLCSEFKRKQLPIRVIPCYWKDPAKYFFPK